MVLDAGLKPGGVIGTLFKNDSIIETGPEAFTTSKPSVTDLCARLGILERIIPANDKNRSTCVAYQGRLHPLPEGFVMLAPTRVWPFLLSGLFSPKGKLRMAMDIFLPPRQSNQDESLAQFVVRRFGREALERAAQPMIGGIHSAHPEMLSMKAVLPKLVELEQRHGSVIRGLIKDELANRGKCNRGTGSRSGQLKSFDLGLSVLIDALVKTLPPGSLKTDCRVTTVSTGRHGRRFDVVTKSGFVIPADSVIIAMPAHQAALILGDIDSVLTTQLSRIAFVSSVLVTRLYRVTDISKQINGSGFVVARDEMRTIKACTFSSVKFQNRAPDGKMLLRIFVDGALKPDVTELSDQSLEMLVSEDLKAYLGISADPVFSLITRHNRTSPQYHVGHREIVTQIEEALMRHPGLALAGNSYAGAGIPDCVASGERAAMSIISTLNTETAASS